MNDVAHSGHHFAQYRFDCAELRDAFVVIGFELVECLDEPYRLTIRLRAEHEGTESAQLLGRDVELAIAFGESERRFHGIVDRVTVDHDATALETCALSVVPALFSLSHSQGTRIFQEQTALEIVEGVLTERLSPYGRSFHTAGVDPARLVKRPYCVQYRETDLDFVHRLLEEEGIGYYFDHGGDKETLVLFDDNRHFAKAGQPVRFGIAPSGAGAWDRLISFPGTAKSISRRVTTRDHDWRLGSRGQLESSGTLAGADREHEVYEHGVGRHHVIHEDTSLLLGMAEVVLTSLVGASLPMPIADLVHDLKGSAFDRFSTSNTDDRGRIRREWHQRDARVFEGVSVVPGLSAGTAFDLVEHPRASVDGEYFVTRVIHSSAPPAISTHDAVQHLPQFNYHNRVHCLARTTPWRPTAATPKPRIDGVHTATVTGPPGSDVHTDPHGRIKVRFPWDRSAPRLDGDHTCWLRVSQAWAGPTAPAFLFVPRVGMEVLVSFLDGDPDRPIVIGCVYNGDNATPSLLPAQATKSIIRTRSIPHGQGYNELSFEDARGMERVYLRAERDLSELVQHDHRVRVDRHEDISIGGSQRESVRLHQNVVVGRHRHESIGGNAIASVMGNRMTSVRGTAHDHVKHDYAIEVDGAMSTHVSSGEWLTHAMKGVTLLQGGGSSMLRMTSDEDNKGIKLQAYGSMIRLTQDRIELRVGGSSIVLTPELIQANDKTLPAPRANGEDGK